MCRRAAPPYATKLQHLLGLDAIGEEEFDVPIGCEMTTRVSSTWRERE